MDWIVYLMYHIFQLIDIYSSWNENGRELEEQVPVVRSLDNAIHWLNHYLAWLMLSLWQPITRILMKLQHGLRTLKSFA